MPQARLDVDFGPLLPLIREAAAAEGISAGELVRALARDGLADRSALADLVRIAVLDLAAAVAPDERFDPADDPREGAAVGRLAALLGSASAAQGVADALHELWARQHLSREEH